jgi:hypothetical protein
MDDGFALRTPRRTGKTASRRPSLGARRLRQWLTEHGMTPAQFGEWMVPPVSGRSIQRWLRGDTRPTFDQAAEIKRRTKTFVDLDHWVDLRQAAN